MTPKHAVWSLIIGSALLRLISAFSSGFRQRRSLSFPVCRPPFAELLRPSADDGLGRDGGLGDVRVPGVRLGVEDWFYPAVRRLNLDSGAVDDSILRRTAGFLAALALNLSGYYGLAASTFALPDGPLLFFWLLTIDRLSVALDESAARPAETLDLGGTGVGWRLAEQVPRGLHPSGHAALYRAHRPKRRWLVQPGPYLAIAMGLVMFSPVIVWNASHGWVSFLFQGGRAVGGWMPRPDYLGEGTCWPRRAICSRGSGSR